MPPREQWHPACLCGPGFDGLIECCILDAIETYVTVVGIHRQVPFLPPGHTTGGFFLPLRAVEAGQEAVTRWAVMYLLFQTLTRLFDLTFQGLKV